MKILITSNTKEDLSLGSNLLSQDYPDAERIYVSDPENLALALQQETVDLAIIGYHMAWIDRPGLLGLIQDHQPGLATILVVGDGPSDWVDLQVALRRSRLTIDALLNTPTDIILLFDTQRKVVLANPTFYQRSGLRPEEVCGRDSIDILPPPLGETRDAVLRQVIETGKAVRFEDRGVDGWLDITVFPIHDEQGQIIHAMVFAHDITERKNLENHLYESHATIDALLNNPTDLIILLDHDGKILRANQTFCQRFHIPKKEAPGLNMNDLLPTAIAQRRSAVIQQVFKTGESVRFEDHGMTGWYDNSIYPILDSQNNVTYVAVVARDITDRKRLEETMRRDQRVMHALANAPNDIYLLLDRSGNILAANEVLAQSLGRQIEELPGLCFWDLLPKPVAEFRRSVFDRVIETRTPERAEDPGRFGIYDSRVIPITDDQNQVVQVVIQARDITERKRTELALKESEERYRTLIETSPDGFIHHDLEGRLLLVNQQFAGLFGYQDAEEIYKSSLSLIELIAEQDHHLLKEMMQSAEQHGYVRDVALTARRKDGSLFRLETNGSIVYDQQGNPHSLIAICRDVTERDRIQDELVKAHQHLEHRVIERTAELQAMNRQLRKEVLLRKEAEEQWRRHALHSEALARVASRANAQLELDAVLQAICDEIIRAMPYPISSVSLYHEKDDSLHIAAYASRVQLITSAFPPSPRAMYEEFIRLFGPTIVLPDVVAFQASAKLATTATPDIRTLVVMPLFHEGELIGSVNMASVGNIRLPTDDELNLLRAISDQAALSISNARLFERVSAGQASLRILTERLVEVQEAEKRHLARELHDEIGQSLTSLSLNLEIVTRSIQADQKKTKLLSEMERIRGQVKQLLDQVRDLSLNLLPAMLEDLGLLPAAMDLCQRFSAQTGIQVDLTHRGLDERFPANLEVAAYRIIQEALTNVARYAGIDQVAVRIWATPQELGLQIEDQGTGFNLRQIENERRSSGISGMRERAASCGGNLEIETLPGQGTCLTVEFPLIERDHPEETL